MKPAFHLLFIYIAALALAGFGDPAYFANKRGVEKYNEKKYEDALKEYLKAQKGDPDEKSIDYNLGGAYYKMGRYDEAVRAYGRALSSGKDNIKKSARFNLGAALYKAGDKAALSDKTDEALESYRESARQYKTVLNKDSADNDARHNLELALLKMKEMEHKKKREQKQQNKKERQKKEQKKKEGQSEKEKRDKSDKKKTGRENKKEEKDTPRQNAENKDRPEDQGQQKQDSQPEPRRISKEQAERIFDAIERDEKKLKENMLKGQLKKPSESGKDW